MLAATLQALSDTGYKALSMEDVAARAHCSKATLYRLWHNKAGPVSAAIRSSGPGRPAEVDTGSLWGDMITVAERLAQHATEDSRLYAALSHAILTDDELAAAVQTALFRLADAADSIASGARQERLPTYGRHNETDRLAVAVNNAFDVQRRAEENIRNFAADASHELRTPLATVSGWLDLYHQGALDDPARLQRALERVDGEVGRMRLLVEELPLLARLDAGRPLAGDPIDLRRLATDVVQDAQVIAPGRTIRLPAPDPVHVTGDAPRLQQVLNNLIGNALQHTPADAAIDVTLPGGRDGRAVLRVADSGPGIAPQDLPRVYDRWPGRPGPLGFAQGP
ncbi:histidine kinase dimerization/phospho-acceptor domain-containing protein [Streptomyces sp. NPDC126497]|uniref:histidine kinase dimerization/phospho-acceptor domain-containing protein n=1 Tax=Streptomyces sp. NPDC126497 TaxID=3155313 RepID=UPI00333002BC